jgi:membrane protein
MPAERPGEPAPHYGRIVALRKWSERTADRYRGLAESHPTLRFPLLFMARYTARHGMLLASAAAFRLFLWLLPLALMIGGVLAAVAEDHLSDVESAAKAAGLTGAASHQMVETLREGRHSWWVAVIVGAVLFLWMTRTLLRNLAVVNAHLWHAPLRKRRQVEVLVSTVCLAGAWLGVLATALFLWRLYRSDQIAAWFVIAVQGLVVSAAWVIICTQLPDARRSWVDLVPGGLLFGYGISLLNAASRTYLPRRFNHWTTLYGSLGIAAVILGSLLLIGQLIVCSAILNSMWSERRARRVLAPGTHARLEDEAQTGEW